ncbi:ethanolamine ammonia-lyase reactivating factor EutA [Halobacteriaceae archaeon SHR40]|uniref:ethanolamine ammonia-lyase reactivating factor EutA n=1 Tax=Halovenus amylolytica TaxID=2500550 RepID=UPI000FE2DAAC
MSEDSLTSVGIDIGTTTTQVVVSRLTVEVTDPTSAGKLAVTDREVLYRGEIHETPLLDPATIDAEGVARIVEQEFDRAGLDAKQIDTGAVIVTGETARSSNAAAVVRELAIDIGEFVVETAGAELEAVLAGRGSGVAAYAATHDVTVANIDIGGGTTNIAIFSGDHVEETRCCRIGGRLIQIEDGRVTAVSDSIHPLLTQLGIEIKTGDPVDSQVLDSLGERMAELLAHLLEGPPYPDPLPALAIGELPHEPIEFDAVSFTGGVGHLVTRGEFDTPFEYRDIGGVLARAISTNDRFSAWNRIVPDEDIRATVIGTGTTTTRLSGRTIGLEEELLPLRNVPVVTIPDLSEADESELTDQVTAGVRRGESLYSSDSKTSEDHTGEREPANLSRFFLAFDTLGPLTYDRLQRVANAIVDAYETVSIDGPILVITRQNCGKALGQSLRRETGIEQSVLVLDEITVDSGTYVDVGTPLADDDTVPVVVKTLVFGE